MILERLAMRGRGQFAAAIFCCLSVAIFCGLSTPGLSFLPPITIPPPSPEYYGFFGNAVGLDDVDGDGAGDFLISSSTTTYLYSGDTQSIITAFPGGYRGLTNDVDGDGLPEVVVDSSGTLEVYRLDSTYVYTISGVSGFMASGIDDVTGDGISDLLYWDTSNLNLISGADGSTIIWIVPLSFNGMIAPMAKGIDDIDGDGWSDVLVQDPGATVGGVQNAGRIFFLSSQSGLEIPRQNTITNEVDAFYGMSATPIPDVDGDGIEDFAIGAPGVYPAGHVHVVSGATGWEISRFRELQTSSFYINGDGVEDAWDLYGQTYSLTGLGTSICVLPGFGGQGIGGFVVGAPTGPDTFYQFITNIGLPGGYGRAIVYGGKQAQICQSLPPYGGTTCTDAYTWSAFDPPAQNPIMASPDPNPWGGHHGRRFGWGVTAVPDINGDGASEVLVSDPMIGLEVGQPELSGRAYLYMSYASTDVWPTDIDFGSVTPDVVHAEQFATIRNRGTAPIGFDTPAYAITGADSSYFSVSDAPSTDSLAIGEAHPFKVSFTPTGLDFGPKSAQLEVYTIPAGTAGPALAGLYSSVKVFPSILQVFADTTVGEASDSRQFRLQNFSPTPLTFTGDAVSFQGANPGDFQFATPPDFSPLAQDEIRIFQVQFAPTMMGDRQAILRFETSDPYEPLIEVDLSGYGAWVTPQAIDFGSVEPGMHPAQTITITNFSTEVINFMWPFISIEGPDTEMFRFERGPLTTPLHPGESREIGVHFAPTLAGEFSARVQFYTDFAAEPSPSVNLQGTCSFLPDYAMLTHFQAEPTSGIDVRIGYFHPANAWHDETLFPGLTIPPGYELVTPVEADSPSDFFGLSTRLDGFEFSIFEIDADIGNTDVAYTTDTILYNGNDLCIDADGTIVTADSEGIVRIDPDTLERTLLIPWFDLYLEGYPQPGVDVIRTDSLGRIWFSRYGLWRFDPSTSDIDHASQPGVTSFVLTASNEAIIQHDYGFYSIDPDTLIETLIYEQPYASSEPPNLPENIPMAMMPDGRVVCIDTYATYMYRDRVRAFILDPDSSSVQISGSSPTSSVPSGVNEYAISLGAEYRPGLSLLDPFTDYTFAGTQISLPFTATGLGGDDVTSVSLYVKVPGSTSFVDTGLFELADSGVFNYTLANGNGEYQFATASSDASGHTEPTPTIAEVIILANTTLGGVFVQSTGSSNQSYIFPMTPGQDAVIWLESANAGGQFSVQRSTPLVPPTGFSSYSLIDEYLTINEGTPSLGTSWNATIYWQIDPASDDLLPDPIEYVYQFEGGSFLAQYPVALVDNTLTIGGVTDFSEWYAGFDPPPPPAKAIMPLPADGATSQSVDLTLYWVNGGGADSFDIYFGTTPSVSYLGSSSLGRFDLPSTLDYSTPYYWRIDSINGGGVTTGDLWTFSTAAGDTPARAYSPSPYMAETGVPIDADLYWQSIDAPGMNAFDNGGFEYGSFDNWTATQGPETEYQPWTISTSGTTSYPCSPTDGSYFALNGFDGGAGLTYDLYRDFTVPAGVTSVSVSWDERFQWQNWGTLPREYEVTLEPAGGGTPIATLTTFQLPAGTSDDTGWTNQSHDLLAIDPAAPGSSYRLHFHEFVPEDFTGPAQFNLDNVALNVMLNSNVTFHVHLDTFRSPAWVSSQSETTYDPGTMSPSETYFWRIDVEDSVGYTIGDPWFFETAPLPDPATNISPTSGSLGISTNTMLYWGTGANTDGFDVFFGEAGSLAPMGYQTESFYNPGTLAPLTDYEWRIDSVGPGGTTTGDVWGFQTGDIPQKAINPDPADGATTVSVNSTLIWEDGGGADFFDIYLGINGPESFFTSTSETSYNLGTMPYDVDVNWRVDSWNSIGVRTGDAWTYHTEPPPPPPSKAISPSPADGATSQSRELLLTWQDGGGADTFDIYFGETFPPIYQGSSIIGEFDPGVLDFGKTYFWRIDSINAGGVTTGDPWSFSTAANGPPLKPTDPYPYVGMSYVPVDTSMWWQSVDAAFSQEFENGGFETGWFDYWTPTASESSYNSWTVTSSAGFFVPVYPIEGNYLATSDFDGNASDTFNLYRDFTVPADAVSAEISWDDRIQWDMLGGTLERQYDVLLEPAGGGAPIATLYSTTLANGLPTFSDTDWMPHTVDLMAIDPGAAGTSYRLSFQLYVPESYTGPAMYFLDDVQLTVEAADGATFHLYMAEAPAPPAYVTSQSETLYTPSPSLNPGTTYLWRVDAENPFGYVTGDEWYFTTYPTPESAYNPSPYDGQIDVSPTSGLFWSYGAYTDSFDVYFGTSEPLPLVSDHQSWSYYYPPMNPQETYLWRIDSNGPGGTTTGATWSFTTSGPPQQAINPSPADWATSQPRELLLTWQNGGGATSYDVYFGDTFPPIYRQSVSFEEFDPGPLALDTTYFWRIDSVSSSGVTTGNTWRFSTVVVGPPVKPTDPYPFDGMASVAVDTDMWWQSIDAATSQEFENGGFESGWFDYWYQSVSPESSYNSWGVNYDEPNAPEGYYYATNAFDGEASQTLDLYREFTVPPDATAVDLSWSDRISWSYLAGALEREYYVFLEPAGGGAPIAVLYSFSLPNFVEDDTGWTTHTVDLLSVDPAAPGSSYRLHFQQVIPEFYTGPAQYYLDDVRLDIQRPSDTTFHLFMSEVPDSPTYVTSQSETIYTPSPSLNPGSAYYWRVDAENPYGYTTGDQWLFSTAPLPGQATVPSPWDGETGVNLSYTLWWNWPTDTQTFDIYFGTSDTMTLVSTQNYIGYTTPTMDPNTTYFWRVDSIGPGGRTTGMLWSFTTGAPPQPASNPWPPDGATGIPTDLTLTWTGDPAATDFEVWLDTVDPPTLPPLYTPTPDWYVSGLATDQTYFWQVNSWDGSQWTYGPVWSFSTISTGGPPEMFLDPLSMNINVEPGNTGLESLLIVNNAPPGFDDLTYNITTWTNDLIEQSEVVGNPLASWTGTDRYRGNLYYVDSDTLLTEIESWLDYQSGGLNFVVLESTDRYGSFNMVQDVWASPATPGVGYHSSGPMNVMLQAGHYYMIGVGWGLDTVAYYGDMDPGPHSVSFGQQVTGWYANEFPILHPAPAQETVTNFVQRLTTGHSWLSIESGSIAAPSGTLPPTDGGTINVVADSTGLPDGIYEGHLMIATNDPDPPTSDVLVLMIVNTPPSVQSVDPPTSTTVQVPTLELVFEFSEPVFDLDIGDLGVSGDAASAAVVLPPVQLGPTTWSYTIDALVPGWLSVELGIVPGGIVDDLGTELSGPNVYGYTVQDTPSGLPGDEDHNGEVTLFELNAVIIAYRGLGPAPSSADIDPTDGTISLGELNAVVLAYRGLWPPSGMQSNMGTATPTPVSTQPSTPTATPTVTPIFP
ncbi:choice-of-anchor D domain-containing protein [bacterium]|nr:choice-of-anchor D domain-containing protein [bacterium]